MTFIKYTHDGKAVIQPAALTLSNLDNEDTLEMHTLDNAIVLLKEDMTSVEKYLAFKALGRLVDSLSLELVNAMEEEGGLDDDEDDENFCGAMLPIPAEAFADAGILYDNLCVFSVDGAVLVVSDDHKTTWSDALTKAILESGKAND